MRREYRERFPRQQLQRKPLVSDPGMHHGTCVTHVPWCMSGSLTRSGGENVPGIPGTCATLNFTYLVRGPCQHLSKWMVFGQYINSCALLNYEFLLCKTFIISRQKLVYNRSTLNLSRFRSIFNRTLNASKLASQLMSQVDPIVTVYMRCIRCRFTVNL